VNDYENQDSLIQHLNQLQISSIFFEADSKITDSIKFDLAKNNITIAPFGTKVNNYVILSKIQEKKINETINQVSSLLSDGKYISLPIVLETEHKTRDDLIKSIKKNFKLDIAIRVTGELNYFGINWVRVNLKQRLAIIVSGDSNSGKTNLVTDLEETNLKIILGDSVLEQVSKHVIHTSDEMLEAVNFGYEKWNWSLSIKEINKTPELRQEFAQIIEKISCNYDFIFEMWMPIELLTEMKSHFIQKRFYVWSVFRVKSIEEDLNFKIKELEEGLDNLRLHEKELDMILRGMMSSNSWKLTKPLRNFKTLLKGFINNIKINSL
jgi:hypothetical protein